MATDGKYCTLVQLKQYILGTRSDANNPTQLNQAVVTTPDDAILSDCLLAAETAFEQGCGTAFDQQTYANVEPFQTFVDGAGLLHLFAKERGPVSAVNAVSFRDLQGGVSKTWQTITFDAVNDLFLPPQSALDTRPYPESWHVRLVPQPALSARATGELIIRWGYTGGYATIPQSLQTLIMRMGQVVYKLREIPVTRVINQPVGTMTSPADYPPDIQTSIRRWSPLYG